MNLSTEQKLAAARFMAGRKMPYFTAALHYLVPVPTPGLGTFGVTEHGRMLYDPQCVAEWSVPELAAVYLHEVGHVLRQHKRRGDRIGECNHTVWNVAGDCEINDDLKAAGLTLPDFKDKNGEAAGGAVYPSTFGLTDNDAAEVYYRELLKQQQQQQQSGGKGKAGPGDGRMPCGSGAGNPLPGEGAGDAAADEAGMPRRTEVEHRNVIARVAEAVQNAAANGTGSVPAGVLRWAGDALAPPVVSWQDKLALATRRAVAFKRGAVDYSYARPARRQASMGYGAGRPIMPSMRAPVPQVSVAFDTSGSMGQDELHDGLSEVAGVLAAVGSTVTFLAADADVHEVRPVHTIKDCLKLLKGGGGTDFRPVFEALRKQRPRPDILVYITDGMGPTPPAQPAGLTVIWLLVGPYQQTPCAWGEVIAIPHARKG